MADKKKQEKMIPPYLLEKIAANYEQQQDHANATLQRNAIAVQTNRINATQRNKGNEELHSTQNQHRSMQNDRNNIQHIPSTALHQSAFKLIVVAVVAVLAGSYFFNRINSD